MDLVEQQPVCKNCGLPIARERHRHPLTPELSRSRSGWTHSDKTTLRGGWQGIRCPGRLTGAEPA